MSTTPTTLEHLAALVARSDATLTAAVGARGKDTHGNPLAALGENIRRTLADLAEAGEIARKILETSAVSDRTL